MKSLPLIAAALAVFAAALPAQSQTIQVTFGIGATSTTVPSGGTASLTAPDIGQSVIGTVTVRNTSTTAASITAISTAGTSELSIVLAPGLPLSLNPNGIMSFGVEYLPSTGKAVTLQIAISFVVNNQAATFPFSVTGASPRLAFSYSVPPNGAATDLNSGDRINFPGTNLGAVSSTTVNVFNRGSASVTVQSIVVTGTGFALSGSAGPVQLPAGSQTSFAVVFNPSSNNGSQGLLVLKVGGSSASFFLTGTGTSTNLTISYTQADGNAHALGDGVTIAFPTIDVNATSTATIEISNQGVGSGAVNSVTLSGTGFRIGSLPVLPVTLAGGQSVRFTIVFAPSQAGSFNGVFRIDLAGRSVSGSLTGVTTSPNLTATYTLADGVVNQLAPGTAIGLPAVDINATTTATIEISNQGTGTGTVSSIAVAGNGFRLSSTPALPATVAAGQSVRFGIVFAPTQPGSYNGTYRIDLSGRSTAGSLTASTAASNISLAYVEPDTNNILPLRDGATLPFPNTAAGTSIPVTLLAINSGAGTGAIDSIALNTAPPSAFQLLNLPAFPASVPPAQQVKFSVRFSPQQQQAYSGSVVVSVNGRPTTFNLQGQGSTAQFTYTYGVTPTSPGATIPMGEIAVGQTTSVTVSVKNAGAAEGQIAAMAVSGNGYSLSDLPSFPFTMKSGTSQSFTLSFAPLQPGTANGRLLIGGDTFAVTGTGIGPRLTYSYSNTGPAVSVSEDGVVILPPLAVGKNEKLQFTIQNTGTSSAVISTIHLAGPSSAFALEQIPALPCSLDAGASTNFVVSFTPGTTGGITASLLVNNSAFTLSGSGTQPASLPSYQFQTPPGTVQPAQQPAIGLMLASPYPLPIDGTLKLSFVSSVFTDDPTIQFATGGRTVNFTIPANSMQAVFNGNPSIALQTGTTAGSIVITPSFAMRGGFDLTPLSPDPLTIPIPRAAPLVSNAAISSLTGTSFTIVLNGYSTTRSIRQLDVQFTPKPGETFSTTHLTLDVSATSSAWYQSSASQTAGGSFLAAIPFVLANGSSTDDLVHRLQSVSVTATNEVGVSTAATIAIQ